MAIQTGNMPAKGAINNMSFYKTKDGQMLKMKSIVNRSTFDSAKMLLTRRHAQEFGLAGRAGKTLRYAVQEVIGVTKDPRWVSRLTTLMFKIAKTDTVSKHGERNVSKGQLQLLHDFNFNADAPLKSHFTISYTPDIDRATGKLSLQIAAFNPGKLPLVPEGATHIRLVSAGSEVDFEGDTFKTKFFDSGELPISAPFAELDIVHQLSANSTLPLFLTLGIQFFVVVNGDSTPIRNAGANTMAIVQLDYV